MVNERISLRAHPKAAIFSEWTAPDGMKLRRMDWPPAKGKKARGGLLFAGGRGDFIEKYLGPFAHWHAAGWSVTAFDWRGQGRSRGEGADAGRDDFGVLVDDLAGLAAGWRAATPGPHVAIGHSMGGHMLLRAIVERRIDLDAAVLVAPMIRVNSHPIPAWLAPDLADTMCGLGFRTHPMWKTPAALTRPGSERQKRLTGSRERYEDELWWWDKEPGFHIAPPTWGWARETYRSAGAAFTPERLGAVDLPILILAAARDHLVSTAAIAKAAADLPRAELELYPDAAHEILREADAVRDRALARIDGFLGRLRP
jgi:lysophospholipase